jgi:dipeptidyl aminopeptidase/acylaminoacyl peptidase
MKGIFTTMLLATCFYATAQQTTAIKANYAQAAKFSPKRLEKMVFSLNVDPHWLKKSDRFWYMYETSEGKKWYIVDAVKGEKKLLFDNAVLAAKLTRATDDPMDAQHLSIDSMRFIKDENWIHFEVKSTLEVEKKDSTAKKGTPPTKEKKIYFFNYNIITGELVQLNEFTKPKRRPTWANISPDSNIIIFGKNYNLWWMDKANYQKALINEDDSTIVQYQLTKDGIEYFSYYNEGNLSGNGDSNTDKEKNKNKRKPVGILWSPDSKHFAVDFTDNRKVKDLWVINSIAEPRPTLETYKYWMPGEKEAPVEHLMLFDWATKTGKEIVTGMYKDQSVNVWSRPVKVNTRDDEYRPAVWLGTADKFYFSRTSRDLKRIDIGVVDVASGTAKTLIQEKLNTYVEIRRLGLVNEGKELIQWSEDDGWGHFYLYDENGKLKNQITSGAWHAEDILGIDEKARVLYFSANGRETGENPYYLHAYRVNFDGSGLKLLTPGDFDWNMSMDDEKKFIVGNFSRVNTTPKSALYAADGRKIIDLETADLSLLMAAGYKFPEIFKAKADDGITDIYGVMYKPFDFDSTKKYPIVEYVYPGPQTESMNTSFSRGMDRTDRLAQIGMVVITLGNRGGHPSRSKWYHNYGYGNLRDYGLADKKTVAEQLANRYSYLDINKVGIHGHSGGGFMSTAAMLVYPDFFKVAVSSAGNHDNAIYNRWWSEKHHGVKEIISEKGDTSFQYNIDKNPDIAKNLKGRLLLSHGEIDNNVHPANTMRVVNALIKANKRFDMILLPTQRHGFGDMTEYFFWRQAEYFARYLMGDTTERPVDVEEINKDIEKKR